MDKNQQLLLRMKKARWLMPFGFVMLTLLLCAGIALAFVSAVAALSVRVMRRASDALAREKEKRDGQRSGK